jgi:carbonic anhydrase
LAQGNCGAVKATIERQAAPGQISALYSFIRPAVEQAGSNLASAIDANAKMQAALLRSASPVIALLVRDRKLKVLAARYDLASGSELARITPRKTSPRPLHIFCAAWKSV